MPPCVSRSSRSFQIFFRWKQEILQFLNEDDSFKTLKKDHMGQVQPGSRHHAVVCLLLQTRREFRIMPEREMKAPEGYNDPNNRRAPQTKASVGLPFSQTIIQRLWLKQTEQP